MEFSTVLEAVYEVLALIFYQLTSISDTITSNPLLYVPVLIALFGGVVMFAISILKRLGIRGVSSAGRRRRR